MKHCFFDHPDARCGGAACVLVQNIRISSTGARLGLYIAALVCRCRIPESSAVPIDKGELRHHLQPTSISEADTTAINHARQPLKHAMHEGLHGFISCFSTTLTDSTGNQ